MKGLYRRLGTCSKCGNCCKWIRLPLLGPPEPEMIEFAAARKIDVQVVGDPPVWVIDIPHRCPQLGDDNLCKDYKNRPLSCRLNPTELWQHAKLGCSFRFVKKEGM